jgi:hypothetical protein
MRVSIDLRGLLGLSFCLSVQGYDPTDSIMDAGKDRYLVLCTDSN